MSCSRYRNCFGAIPFNIGNLCDEMVAVLLDVDMQSEFWIGVVCLWLN